MNIIRAALISVALVTAGHAFAQSKNADETMRRVQNALGVLNQELTATYDQIKTLQTTLETNRRSVDSIHSRGPGLTMEQIETARRKASDREEELQSQIDLAFARIKDIELQKQPLLRRLQEQLRQEDEASQ